MEVAADVHGLALRGVEFIHDLALVGAQFPGQLGEPLLQFRILLLGGQSLCPVEGQIEVAPAVVQLVDFSRGGLAVFQEFPDRFVEGIVWNNSDIFMEIRNRSELKNRCGSCEFTGVCGGCRARAFGNTGDYMEEDVNDHYKSSLICPLD